MSAIQAFLLGAMAVCTPSLIVLGWVAWHAPHVDESDAERPAVRRKGYGA